MNDIDFNAFKGLIDNGSGFTETIDNLNNYKLYVFNGSLTFVCTIGRSETPSIDQIDYESNYKSLSSLKAISGVEVKEQVPFAKPDYRTKRDATSEWKICLANSVTVSDFMITEERYVTGGEIIFKNAKEGDYITAEVYDVNNLIPEPYRAALCENHPVVAKYVVKKWLMPTPIDGYDSFEIDTYPLNAKISAGLSLRVSYHSTSEAGDRKVAINYHLTQKL